MTGGATISTRLPAAHSVRELLAGMTGRDVDLTTCSPFLVDATHRASVAVYTTDKLRTAAVAVVDMGASARIAAALSMLPAGGADDAVAEGELSKLLRDNLYEVLNVLSSMFNLPGAPHVRLYRLYPPGEAMPADLTPIVRSRSGRLDMKFTIAGYGEGALAIIVA